MSARKTPRPEQTRAAVGRSTVTAAAARDIWMREGAALLWVSAAGAEAYDLSLAFFAGLGLALPRAKALADQLAQEGLL